MSVPQLHGPVWYLERMARVIDGIGRLEEHGLAQHGLDSATGRCRISSRRCIEWCRGIIGTWEERSSSNQQGTHGHKVSQRALEVLGLESLAVLGADEAHQRRDARDRDAGCDIDRAITKVPIRRGSRNS